MPDNEFEKDLRDAGTHIEYPPTPDLASVVRARIEEDEPAHSSPRPSFLAPKWVAAAVLVVITLPALAGLVTLAGGGAGGGSAEGGSVATGGGGADSASKSEDEAGRAAEGNPAPSSVMEETDADSAASGSRAESAGSGDSGVPADSAASYGEVFDFGEPIPLDEARARKDAPLLLPTASGLDRPDEVYAGRPPREDGYVLVYGARNELPPLGESGIGLILTELDGGLKTYLADAAATGIEEVGVDGKRGYWAPNGVGTTSPLGNAENLPGNVLIWERDGRAFRLQAAVEKEAAIRIAQSVR
ncbi:MAG: hypothetical protein M3518_04800 [Actinomycetota bacterium]|nr:hypothetical protein [Actinomycetota bacterium]